MQKGQLVKLSVIIVNYNVKYFLEQCLLTVQKALIGIESEIFVVDNHSVDGSVDMIRNSFPEVKLIANEDNVGFAVANNQAIELTQGEYVLLLNPDTVVREDSFSSCIEFMDSHSEAGALGVKMIDGKGNFLPESKRGLPTPEVALYKMLGLNKLFPRSKRFGKYHLGFLGEDDINEVDVLAGAYMFIRKKVLDEIGLLDETFFMYGEDVDLSYRITEAGYKNYYFPSTSIIHYKGESTKKMSVNYVFIFYRAMVIFARKHYKGAAAQLLTFFINSAIYVRAALAVIQRFLASSWLIIVDTLLLFLGMYFLKNYWEEHIKFIDSYPKELMTIHVPYYIFFWVSTVYLSGGYQQPFSIKRVLRGIIVGSVLIAAVYGLMPNELRFSRALIILGAIWSLIAMLVVRLVVHYKRHKNLNFGSRSSLNTVVVGKADERARVAEMLKQSNATNQLLGFVSVDEETGDELLGTVERLEDLCEVYKIEEVIFCAKDLSSSEIMSWMAQIQDSDVNFKILPEKRYFVIGSNSKNTSGEFYTEEIRFNLGNDYNHRKKRLFDIGIASGLLILCWLVLPVAKFRKNYFRNALDVILGKRTWVTYDRTVSVAHLPNTKDGIFFVTDEVRRAALTKDMRDKLNFLYAKNYSVEQDLTVLFKGLFTKRK